MDFPGTISGEISLENRYYLEEGSYGNNEQGDSSILIKPEYSYSWNNDRHVFTFIPYARLSQLDDEKSHFDIRELSYVGSWNNVELRFGISKVFWGVTESQHLVDVINQTDLVENPDGEDKLGQPMIAPSLITDYGSFQAFLLPYFRERTFPGEKGRFRSSLPIDNDGQTYSNEDEERNIDYALRWSHYHGSLEWALSYFKGTDRDPNFIVNESQTALIANYGESEQVSLELQYNYKDWLFKSEILNKDSQFNGDYFATVTGFEYTFSNIKNKGTDIGVLYEYLYDERKEETATGLYNTSFLATRIALNDEKSTELLAGLFFDNEEKQVSLARLEASRRISENWKWELEFNSILNPQQGSLLNTTKNDDYLQFNLSFYW